MVNLKAVDGQPVGSPMGQSSGIYGFAEVSVDRAGRFNLPSDMVSGLGTDTSLRVNVSPDRSHLEIRTKDNFEKFAGHLMEEAARLGPEVLQAAAINYLGFSLKVQIDSANRITIPKKFREIVGGSEVVLVGVGDTLQVWNRDDFIKTDARRREVLEANMPALLNAVYGVSLPGPEQIERRQDGLDRAERGD